MKLTDFIVIISGNLTQRTYLKLSLKESQRATIKENMTLFRKESEEVVGKCSSKYVLLNMSQISQENTCVAVLF